MNSVRDRLWILSLRELKNLLESVIEQAETTDFFPMSEQEQKRLKQQLGEFDYLIGNFGIKCLRCDGEFTLAIKPEKNPIEIAFYERTK